MGRPVTGKKIGTVVVRKDNAGAIANALGIKKGKLKPGKVHIVHAGAVKKAKKAKRKTAKKKV